MSRQIVSVYVDIARFIYEVGQVPDKELTAWTKKLAKCLAIRDPSIHEYGGSLLREVEDWRRSETERKKHKNLNPPPELELLTNPPLYINANRPKDGPANMENKQKTPNDSALSKDSALSALSALSHYRSDQIRSGREEERREETPLSPPMGGNAEIQKPHEQFEAARKIYPGTKNGFKSEWENFKRKAGKNFHLVAPLLLPAVLRELSYRKDRISAGGFVPEWAHFRTWINQHRWEQEFSKEVTNGNGKSHLGQSRNEKLERDARVLGEKIRAAESAH